MKYLPFILLTITTFIVSAQRPLPNDRKATKETINLYQNLMKLKDEGMMFGHQDDLAYGEGWVYEEGRSDVKDVVGEYPAVYGWELGHLELGDAYSLDSVHFDKIKGWIKTVYERGGVNTISWHIRNPLTGGTSWDTSSKKAVASVLPGGEKHELFKTWLDRMADFLLALKTDEGTYIPVLFRPWHEHTGSWFWWGQNLSSVEDYKALWRFTVNYLQNEKDVHHVLYTYSTDRFKSEKEYLERYPGDDVIDILGFDLYDRGSDYQDLLSSCTATITRLAREKNKLPVVSETGGPIAENTKWWTETLLEALLPYNVSYVLVWRNPWQPASHGAFAPYKGSPDSENFIKFYNHPKTLFQEQVTKMNLYK